MTEIAEGKEIREISSSVETGAEIRYGAKEKGMEENSPRLPFLFFLTFNYLFIPCWGAATSVLIGVKK